MILEGDVTQHGSQLLRRGLPSHKMMNELGEAGDGGQVRWWKLNKVTRSAMMILQNMHLREIEKRTCCESETKLTWKLFLPKVNASKAAEFSLSIVIPIKLSREKWLSLTSVALRELNFTRHEQTDTKSLLFRCAAHDLLLQRTREDWGIFKEKIKSCIVLQREHVVLKTQLLGQQENIVRFGRKRVENVFFSEQDSLVFGRSFFCFVWEKNETRNVSLWRELWLELKLTRLRTRKKLNRIVSCIFQGCSVRLNFLFYYVKTKQNCFIIKPARIITYETKQSFFCVWPVQRFSL